MSVLDVRVDPGTAAFLDWLARESGRNRSDVVREALEALRERVARRAAVAPVEAMAHLIGCWDSGASGFPSAPASAFGASGHARTTFGSSGPRVNRRFVNRPIVSTG